MTELPYNRPPRSRLPWVIAGILLVIVLVVVAAWWGSANAGDDEAAPPVSETPTPSESEAEPTATGVDGPDDDLTTRPTGCIAGNGRDADMLLEARELSPQTANGAVEFAAAVLKFTYRYPYPTKDELRAIEEMYADDYDLISAYDTEPTIAPDVAPAGTPIQATMVGGAWYLHDFSEDRAEITIAYFWEIDGVRDGSIARASNVVLQWGDHGWMMTRQGDNQLRSQEVLDLGSAFAGAC